jgi:adenylosuccinate synthase
VSKTAVIGLGFGDEGKGVVTNYLCSKDPKNILTVRFSGGHQSGHKVYLDKIEHVFANFGAGTLLGCPTYWSKFCTFEPVGFMRELNILEANDINPKIYIDPECPVTTPYDIYANHQSEEIEHGTTGTGFWRTLKRHEKLKLTVFDLMAGSSIYKIKTKTISDYYKNEIDTKAFYDSIKSIISNPNVIITTEKKIPFSNIVFEGSQGLLLDKDIGFFPHVTPSKIDATNIIEMGIELDNVFLVTRAYQTRHGNGPMTNLDLHLDLKNSLSESNKTNEFQGEFRRSALDLDLLEYGIQKAILPENKNLVVTCLDQINKPYTFTYKNKIHRFDERKDFIWEMGKILPIDGDLYGCDSPFSSSVKKL